MCAKRFTDDEIAEIIASAQALTDMPVEERRAAELLKELLGGEYTPRDCGGAQGMHDFDLEFDNGRVVVVEVTTDTSAADRAFWDQIERISPLAVPGLQRVWHVDLSTPGDGPGDQRAVRRRVEALKAELPGILSAAERSGLTELRVPRSPPREAPAAMGGLRGLGVRLCHSFDPTPEQSPCVLFGAAGFGGATGPDMIVDAVNEHLPRKLGKLLDAKDAGAAEAHMFLWLKYGQEHTRGRAEAMSFLKHIGLEPIDLRGIDAVWVAVDAGPRHAPDCRHLWPILCFDADGWHDWRLRRSP